MGFACLRIAIGSSFQQSRLAAAPRSRRIVQPWASEQGQTLTPKLLFQLHCYTHTQQHHHHVDAAAADPAPLLHSCPPRLSVSAHRTAPHWKATFAPTRFECFPKHLETRPSYPTACVAAASSTLRYTPRPPALLSKPRLHHYSGLSHLHLHRHLHTRHSGSIHRGCVVPRVARSRARARSCHTSHAGSPGSNWTEHHQSSTVSNILGWPSGTSQWHKPISKL